MTPSSSLPCCSWLHPDQPPLAVLLLQTRPVQCFLVSFPIYSLTPGLPENHTKSTREQRTYTDKPRVTARDDSFRLLRMKFNSLIFREGVQRPEGKRDLDSVISRLGDAEQAA